MDGTPRRHSLLPRTRASLQHHNQSSNESNDHDSNSDGEKHRALRPRSSEGSDTSRARSPKASLEDVDTMHCSTWAARQQQHTEVEVPQKALQEVAVRADLSELDGIATKRSFLVSLVFFGPNDSRSVLAVASMDLATLQM